MRLLQGRGSYCWAYETLGMVLMDGTDWMDGRMRYELNGPMN